MEGSTLYNMLVAEALYVLHSHQCENAYIHTCIHIYMECFCFDYIIYLITIAFRETNYLYMLKPSKNWSLHTTSVDIWYNICVP
jgi:hypothetical protein